MAYFSSRILILTTAYKPYIGGSEIAIESIARELPGIFFDILTPRYDRRLPRMEENGNVRIIRVGMGMFLDKYLFPFFGAIHGWILAGENKYMAMHAYQASYGAAAAWALSFFGLRLPFILTLQEGKELYRQPLHIRALRRILIMRADKHTAISRYLADFIRKLRPNSDVSIIPNGADVRKFSQIDPADIRRVSQELRIPADRHLLITVSRLVRKNGIKNLIKALPLILEKTPVCLLVIGNGPLLETLEALALEEGVSDHVTFAGAIPHAHLPAYLAGAEVFVRPSLSEGMGNVFVESMAAGVPVVASAVGGITDLIRDKENGVFCDPKSPASIADAVTLLLNDKELRERIIKNGRRIALEKYDWRVIAGQMSDLYNSLSPRL